MTAEERAEILVTARLLRAVEKVGWLATGLTMLAAASILFLEPRKLAIAALAFGIVSIVYVVRIGFDARLFEDAAMDRLTMTDLDVGLRRAEKAGRTWSERCRGARRLVAICGAATVGQLVAVALMGWS